MKEELEHAYAYEMGKDSVINGPNEKNCNFRIFASVEGMRAWEKGVREERERQERRKG